ncbi:protein translocase subunit SecF [Nanoarchaeota archaeon]
MSRRDRRLLRRKGKKVKESVETKEQVVHEEKVRKKQGKLLSFYEKNYKKNMWITVILLVISLAIIIGNGVMTGDFIHRGISLKGGVTVTIPFEDPVDIKGLEEELRGEFEGGVNVRALSRAGTAIGVIVDATDVEPDDLVSAIEARLGELPKISVETMGSALGDSFFKQTIIAIVIAFLLMAIVVFIAFKTFIPGLAVILSAFSDMIMTIAVLDLFKIKIETAGIAALLMLIGYSVDTDILLTTRVLRREVGTVFDRCMGAMKTGMTMTATSFAAIFVGYFFTQSETLRQIMLILLIGLVFDVVNTWIQNVGILRWYMENKSKKHAHATVASFQAPIHRLDNKEEKPVKEHKESHQHHEHHEHHEHHKHKEEKPVHEHKEHHTHHDSHKEHKEHHK